MARAACHQVRACLALQRLYTVDRSIQSMPILRAA
jgi:hypothetical protein